MNAPDWGAGWLAIKCRRYQVNFGGCLGGNEERSLDSFPKHTAVHE